MRGIKGRTLSIAAGLALAVAGLTAASALAAPSPGTEPKDPGTALVDTVHRFKREIGKAPKLDEKVARLRELKSYLDTEAPKLVGREGTENRRLRMAVSGLQIYFGHLHDRELAQGDCSSARTRILFSASPRNPDIEADAELPGEAREALGFLELFCGH